MGRELAPIIGANRPEQLRDTLSGLDTALPSADVATLDEVSDFRKPRHVREGLMTPGRHRRNLQRADGMMRR